MTKNEITRSRRDSEYDQQDCALAPGKRTRKDSDYDQQDCPLAPGERTRKEGIRIVIYQI